MKSILIAVFCVLSSMVYSQNRIDAFIQKLESPAAVSGAKVTLTTDRESRMALSSVRDKNTFYGYRICIFSDNSQSARAKGESAIALFESKYPGVPYIFPYNNPIYKVLVGNFLSRNEANRMLGSLRNIFPQAFIVSEEMPLSLFMSQKSIPVDAPPVVE